MDEVEGWLSRMMSRRVRAAAAAAMGERGAGSGIQAGGKEPAAEAAQGTRGRRAGGESRRGCGLGDELQESEEKERKR